MRLNPFHKPQPKNSAEYTPYVSAHDAKVPLPITAQDVTYDVLSSNSKVGIKIAAHLLELETTSRDDETVLHSADELQKGIEDEYYRLAVARLGMAHLGVALAELDQNEYTLVNWYVVERHRGKGIGKELLTTLGFSPEIMHDIVDTSVGGNLDSNFVSVLDEVAAS